ncbi:MAG: MSMEG_0567/Sll0786 family nitrogen starvation N-acetyltransferase [Acidimicrobiia bacterium]
MADATVLAPPADQRWSLRTRVAQSAEELALHHRIRHLVFVAEQGIFAGTDVDTHDGDASTIKVIGTAGSVVAGAVRLYPLEPAGGLWQGDRLAVLPAFRIHGLGRPLVRFAVATAARLGGREMQAHIQPANVRFFERLGWERRGPVEVYVGLPHQPMAIDLTAVAPEDPS